MAMRSETSTSQLSTSSRSSGDRQLSAVPRPVGTRKKTYHIFAPIPMTFFSSAGASPMLSRVSVELICRR